jgi:hypothetical protein
MNRDDILKMAREAGFNDHHDPDLYDCMVASEKAIERFAALVAAAEREACARVCEEYNKRQCYNDEDMAVANECAAAIRARGEKK